MLTLIMAKIIGFNQFIYSEVGIAVLVLCTHLHVILTLRSQVKEEEAMSDASGSTDKFRIR
jgi:hypothetical protein